MHCGLGTKMRFPLALGEAASQDRHCESTCQDRGACAGKVLFCFVVCFCFSFFDLKHAETFFPSLTSCGHRTPKETKQKQEKEGKINRPSTLCLPRSEIYTVDRLSPMLSHR